MKLLIVFSMMLILTACGDDRNNSTEVAGAGKTIKSSGEVVATRMRSITPPQFENAWNVKISMLQKDGSRVRPGMVIVRYDTQDLMEKLRTRKAEVDQKNKELEQQHIKASQQLEDLQLAIDQQTSNLDKARLKADIPNSLLASKDYEKNQLNLKLSELELQRAETALRLEAKLQKVEKEGLEGEREKSRNKVAELEADISKATVIADEEGIFVVGRDHRGNRVKVGDQVWRGRKVAEIPDMQSLQILLQIPEREAARVQPGQKVRFRLDAKPEEHFEGVVESRGSVVRNRSRNQPAKVFDTRVTIDHLDPELMRPGMRVTAEIFSSIRQ
ncbi:MAG: HlyD family efflux transporter periplasmic adaptor subunit [Xanthomonadales bacterium]|nr:HlyD family efflux transporter periplasmic adaptor subunit [Xanthomonadales bacterium]